MKNLGHRVARSTVANILKEQGIPPSGERPMSWRTFLRAHWGAIRGGNFLTAGAWTIRAWVAYYMVFVIELRLRRVRVLASTPHRHEPRVPQVVRQLVDVVDGELAGPVVRVCDRNHTWSTAVHLRHASGVRVIRTPVRASNCHAHAPPFVHSITECRNRVIPPGGGHDRRSLANLVADSVYVSGNIRVPAKELIARFRCPHFHARLRRHCVGGLLNHYGRAA